MGYFKYMDPLSTGKLGKMGEYFKGKSGIFAQNTGKIKDFTQNTGKERKFQAILFY